MCVKPKVVFVPRGPKHVRTEAPCGKCWACRKNKVSDLVAKAMFEEAASDYSFAVTLTYDDKRLDDPDQARVLHSADFKRFMARLRKKFPVRYLAAGEYGRKGRAHWHAIIFGVGIPPEIPPLRTRENWKPWPWGFSFVDTVDFRTIEYVAKYLTKKDDPKREQTSDHFEEMVRYSKNPPLGLPAFLALADKYVDQRIFPRSFRVNPPGIYAEKRRFQISGVSQHLFLERIFWQWPEAFDVPKTEWMENATRRYVKWRAKKHFEALPPQEQAKIVMEHHQRPSFSKFLTNSRVLWEDYLQDHGREIDLEQQALTKWLSDQGSRTAADRRRKSRVLRP